MKLKLMSFIALLFINLSVYAGVDTSTDDNGIILAGHDAVAYFTESKAVQGSAEFTATYQDATYQFSSAENRDLFKADPAKYAPQYGGFCSYGTSLGRKFAVDGKGFKIVDGKLYVNKNPYVHELWLKNESDLIVKANDQWKDIESVPAEELD